VTVADTGQGIAEEDREKVFQSFYTTKKNGMGIGLSIARSLIRQQRGRIWAETNPLGGAMVRFTVPTDLTTRE